MTARAPPPFPAQKRNYPPSRAGNALMHGEAKRQPARCLWCRAGLTGKQVHYCGPACRSSASRRKHNQAMKVLAGLGIPKATAREMMGRFGLAKVEERLNGLGWVYYPRLKAFYFDGVAQRRAAA